MTDRRAQIRITASRSPARGVQTGGNHLPEAVLLIPPDATVRATGPATPEAAAEMGREEARTRGAQASTGVAPPLHAPTRLGGPHGIGWWPIAIRRAYEEGSRAEVAAQRRTAQVLRSLEGGETSRPEPGDDERS
jgi:hypothetical protein